MTERIVKRCIQMIMLAFDSQHIPGMTIFDPLLRICLRQSNHAPDTQIVTENFDGLGNSLTDAHAMSESPDDFMGVCFFQFIICDILADKIVNILFFPLLIQFFCGTDQFPDTRLHGLLMLFDFIFRKQIFRLQFHIL